MEQILSETIPVGVLEPELPRNHSRLYDRLRQSIGSIAGKAADLPLLIPDLFMLLGRLTMDGRVRLRNKLLLAGALVYFIAPFDFLPEAILGPIGYLDDLILAAYAVNRVLQDTDRSVLHQQWSGRGEVLESVRRMLSAADTMVVRRHCQGRSVVLSDEILPLQAGTTGGGPT